MIFGTEWIVHALSAGASQLEWENCMFAGLPANRPERSIRRSASATLSPRRTVHFVALHVLDNSFTLFTSRAGSSSTVDAAFFIVVSSDFTVGLPVISTSCPT